MAKKPAYRPTKKEFLAFKKQTKVSRRKNAKRLGLKKKR